MAQAPRITHPDILPTWVPILLLGLNLVAASSCRNPKKTATRPRVVLKLWHTFNEDETRVLNQILRTTRKKHASWDIRSTVLPFGQAQNAFRRATEHCTAGAPDILRVEVPWIASLVTKKLLRPLPRAGEEDDAAYVSAARSTLRYRGKRWSAPASVDGLALLYNTRLVKVPPTTLEALVAAGKRLTIDAQGRSAESPAFNPSAIKRWGFYVRGDGYWFLPFLWAFGGDLLDPPSKRIFIADAPAVRALRYYRDLTRVHHIAPHHLRLSNDYEDQMQRFVRGEIAMMLNGPWATAGLLRTSSFADPKKLGIAPFPRGPSAKAATPLSGHAYVVTRCSRHPDAAWALARVLSGVDAQARFAKAAGLLPALKAAYADPRVTHAPWVSSFRRALERGRPRPQDPIMGRIFDDFTAAIQAVLLGDATAREALEGVARSWRRLLRRRDPVGEKPSRPASRPAPATRPHR
ncbi:MAG: extracellular solute-binding protein [Deltaproteobacteria bacterium]|nr:extracellular solute-binding protein [Deltaproteobacteria bacterium]